MDFLAILQTFDKKEVEVLHRNFREELETMRKQEKEFCVKAHVEPKMTNERALEVLKLLEKCHTAYHVEALKRFVLQEMVIPEWQDIDVKANDLMTKALHV